MGERFGGLFFIVLNLLVVLILVKCRIAGANAHGSYNGAAASAAALRAKIPNIL
jgi:hypothetical protein